MIKLHKIVCVDNTKLSDEAIEELKRHADQVEVYTDTPENDKETIERIGDAEAMIVSWRTPIGEEVIKAANSLKYIGMACSLYDDESANVAVKFAREKGISVKGIFDYGDPGVAEFIISELIQLLNGYKGKQWKEEPHELTDLKFGIIGLGVTGQLLAKCLEPFGADLYYHSRSRKEEWEEKGVKYLPLDDLLQRCDVISMHLPKNTRLLGNKEFELLGENRILINTSLGLPFDQDEFRKWVKREGNYAIFDADGKKELQKETEELPTVIASEISAGWSVQTRVRLSQKVLQNLKEFLKEGG